MLPWECQIGESIARHPASLRRGRNGRLEDHSPVPEQCVCHRRRAGVPHVSRMIMPVPILYADMTSSRSRRCRRVILVPLVQGPVVTIHLKAQYESLHDSAALMKKRRMVIHVSLFSTSFCRGMSLSETCFGKCIFP